MADKPKKKKVKKPKAEASKKADKASSPPDWAKATRYEIYRD